MTAPEWDRMRAGFAVQGPYRRSRRVMRWLLVLAVLFAWVGIYIGATRT